MSSLCFKSKTNRGFTILELMVVMAIVLFITGTVINYIPQFRDRSALDLVAQEIAINVRGAQIYASSGKAVEGAFGVNNKPSYGVNFVKDESRFFVYANVDNDDGFSESDVVEENYNLDGVVIENICLINDGNQVCNQSSLDIIYTRPRLEAKICVEGICDNEEVMIVLQAIRSEKQKQIFVHNNGQIGVESVQ